MTWSPVASTSTLTVRPRRVPRLLLPLVLLGALGLAAPVGAAPRTATPTSRAARTLKAGPTVEAASVSKGRSGCSSPCDVFGEQCCPNTQGIEMCVDPDWDHANCGGCGNRCDFWASCHFGTCVCQPSGAFSIPEVCEQHETCTRFGCHDLENDPHHCGAGGVECRRGETCVEGVCVAGGCPRPITVCGGTCVDVKRSDAHCGACGNACPGGTRCEGGVCQPACPPEQTLCAGTCVSLRTDARHCGACGQACAAHERCLPRGIGGAACRTVCPAPSADCGDGCHNLDVDDAHCGACGNRCPPGTQCANGTCMLTCAPGLTDCDGRCVDLDDDNRHCGACGVACAPGSWCEDAQCRTGCAPGLMLCDDRCVDLDDDREHCGACGVGCTPGSVCNGFGQCQVDCQAGLTNCQGTCVDLSSHHANCGSCGETCPTGTGCDGTGQCAPLCGAGQTRCGQTCVDLSRDDAHCGSCGDICQPAERCVDGVCEVSASTVDSAATDHAYLPYWSLDGADTRLVIRSIGAATSVLLRVFDVIGDEHFSQVLSLPAESTTSVDLRSLSPVLVELGAGALFIEPQAGATPSLVAETQVHDVTENNVVVFQHLALTGGVFPALAPQLSATVADLGSAELLVFCPASDLASALLSAGALPGAPNDLFASSVDVFILDDEGEVLAAPTPLCESVTVLRPSDYVDVSPGERGGVELRAPLRFLATTGQWVAEDVVFYGVALNRPPLSPGVPEAEQPKVATPMVALP